MLVLGSGSQADNAQTELVAMEMAFAKELASETVQGTVQGQVSGQATGFIGNSDVGPLGKLVSQCRTDLAKPEDDSQPKHLFVTVDVGDRGVATPSLDPPLALDIVGNGRATALVQLNPSASTFPIPQSRSLPEASFEIEVDRLEISIAGPGPQVEAGQSVEFVATADGVSDLPRMSWSIIPGFALADYGAMSERVRFYIPGDLPDGSNITLTATAQGSFISEKSYNPSQSVVLSVGSQEKPEADTPEDVVEMACDFGSTEFIRPRGLVSGKPFAGSWVSLSGSTLGWGLISYQGCRTPQPENPGGVVYVIAPDPDGLSVPYGQGKAALGKVEKADFITYLEQREGYGGPLRSCLAPSGFPNFRSWLEDPQVEVFVHESADRNACRGFTLTDGDSLLLLGDLVIDWEGILYQRADAN